MASSPYFLSESSPRPSSNGPRSAQIRSGPPPPSPPPTSLHPHSHHHHHRNASVSLSEMPFPGFQTPARDAGLRPIENSAFSSRPERSPSFGRTPEYGYGEGGGAYGGGGAGGTGGKLRSAKKQTKRTPYERPPTGRHATAGGSASIASASSGGSSIASKIRDSASRLITSSASYLYASLFKSRPLALRSKGDSQKEQIEGNDEEVKDPCNGIDEQNGIALEDLDGMERVTRKLDIVQVEEVLKQRTWSRDQVNRLTEILQSRLSENSCAKPNTNSYVTPNVKGYLELPKNETENSTPIQVARAYMEDQGARPVGITTSSLHTPLPVQSSAQRRILEDRYTSSPRTSARSSGTIRMLKRSFALEEDLPSVGPVRRVRQKTSILPASPYLYSRQIGGSSALTQKKTTSLMPKSSETALKILETLDKFSPSPKPKALTEKSPPSKRLSLSAKGKCLDEHMVTKSPDERQIPETSKDGEQSWRRSPSKVTNSKSPEASLNGEKVGPSSTNLETAQYPVIESRPLISSIPVGRPKGFRMSAMFEESISDEECKLDVEPLNNAKEAASVKPSFTTMASVPPPASEVSVPTSDSIGPFLLQSNITKVKSESIPINVSPPRQWELPSMDEKPPSTLLNPLSTATSATIRPLPVGNGNAALSAAPSMIATQGEVVSLPSACASVSTLTSVSLPTDSDFKVPVSSSLPPFEPIFQAQPSVTTVSEPVLFDSVNIVASAPLTPMPERAKTAQGIQEITEVQNGFLMTPESPIPEKGSELETMATDAMAEETGPSIAAIPSGFMPASSSASTFSFGGSPMSSSSAFSFTAATSSSSSSMSSLSAPVFAFGGQTSSSLSKVSMTSSNPLANSFSASSSSTFVFGSSPSSSSGLFTSNSSGSSSLTTCSTPPFQFGASTPPSSSNLFSSSAASTSSAFGFVSSSSSTSPSIGSSATPFLFGGASVNASQASSSGSIAQSFTFGSAQSNPSTGSSTVESNSAPNPFAPPSGASGASPFQFAPSTTTSGSGPSTTFSFGSTNVSSTAPASVFSFGASAPAAASPMAASSQSTFSFASSSTFSFGSTGTTSSPSPSAVFGSNNAIPFGSNNTIPSSSSNAFTFGSNPTPNPSTFGANPFGVGQPSATPMFGGSTQQTTFGSSQPTFGSSQVAAQPTFGSSQPAAQPTFGSSQPAAQSTFGSSQLAAQPTFGSAQAAGQPMFGSTQPTFGSTQPPAMASFGQAQPTPPSQFTFGGQSTNAAPQQPSFAFGGQPGMPAQNPFSVGSVSQPGADFAGGFALGATGGGERSGRKFIKAKRTGAAKRGGK